MQCKINLSLRILTKTSSNPKWIISWPGLFQKLQTFCSWIGYVLHYWLMSFFWLHWFVSIAHENLFIYSSYSWKYFQKETSSLSWSKEFTPYTTMMFQKIHNKCLMEYALNTNIHSLHLLTAPNFPSQVLVDWNTSLKVRQHGLVLLSALSTSKWYAYHLPT